MLFIYRYLSHHNKGFAVALQATRCLKTTRHPWILPSGTNSAFLTAGAPARDDEETSSNSERRVSALGIQMISKSLHEQIFGHKPEVSEEAVRRSKQHLKSLGLKIEASSAGLPDVNLRLPPLLGEDINEHFTKIAEQQSQPYLALATRLAKAKLPEMPKKWSLAAGWTRYDGNTATSVPYPEEDALILDVEVCVKDSERPILATAVSEKSWYSWVSKRLVSHEDYDIDVHGKATPHDLIALETEEGSMEPASGSWRKRVVVGHHVSYDRARIKEQYLVKGPLTKFLDTLSLHVCVAGQTAAQKIMWHKQNGVARQQNGGTSDGRDNWLSVSSPNSLVDVHWLHVGSKVGSDRLDKEKRNIFIKGKIQDVRKHFQSSMRYCANDVLHTHEVLSAVLPLFLQRCPHPVTLAGMLEMGGAYLPVNSSWEKYIADAEYTYEEMEGEIKAKLMALADNACTYIHGKRYQHSPWLCNLDWESKKFRGKAKKKDMASLMEKIEGYYRGKEEEFQAGRTEEEAGEEEEGEERKFEFFISGDHSPKRSVHMPGYPEWYRSLCMRRTAEQWRPGAVLVSAQTRVAPYLLRMKWKGFPLHYHSNLGWGYIVPQELQPGEVPNLEEEDVGVHLTPEGSRVNLEPFQYDLLEEEKDLLIGNGAEEGALNGERYWRRYNGKKLGEEHGGVADDLAEKEAVMNEEAASVEWRAEKLETPFGVTDDVVTLRNGKTYHFFRLPHKDGAESNVGNPLAKGYLHQMENGTLTSAAGRLGQRILTLNSMTSFWRSARQRVLEQFVVWNRRQDTEEDGQSDPLGVILPQLVVAGTVTRRAVEPTWLTASNAKETRVGSELKAMVQAPHGYHFVGADVDSQELWIASVLGDMHFAGMHGSTAIGWMTLQGTKAEGTDVHSKTAATIGISRDQAKILNYGRFYGAGRPFIELLLKQFNPSLSGKEVEEKARALLEATKGKRLYKLTEQGKEMVRYCGVEVTPEGHLSAEESKRLRWVTRYTEGRLWAGGSESDLFNKLESIATSAQPTTPVLGCIISKALETQYTHNSFSPSKVNWVVQSSAVDYLHLMLVATKWLSDAYNIEGRFSISIHDEVRYLVKSEDRYRFALALQYANLLTRAMFSHQLNMNDLPMSVAFFSAVDIDKCLRKEATMDCQTPSNPLGLEKGHNIPEGEVLNIYEILDKTEGCLER